MPPRLIAQRTHAGLLLLSALTAIVVALGIWMALWSPVPVVPGPQGTPLPIPEIVWGWLQDLVGLGALLLLLGWLTLWAELIFRLPYIIPGPDSLIVGRGKTERVLPWTHLGPFEAYRNRDQGWMVEADLLVPRNRLRPFIQRRRVRLSSLYRFGGYSPRQLAIALNAARAGHPMDPPVSFWARFRRTRPVVLSAASPRPGVLAGLSARVQGMMAGRPRTSARRQEPILIRPETDTPDRTT